MRRRGLLGFVYDSGKWRKPNQIGRVAKPDALVLEYRKRREQILREEDTLQERIKRLDDPKTSPETLKQTLAAIESDKARLATTHYLIGVWCMTHALKAESIVHYTTATRYDPDMSKAWYRLDFVRHQGRWIASKDLNAVLAEEGREARLFAKWRTPLKRYRADLAGDKFHRKRAT